ncbi:MAG: MobA/MobL family protein, partial [Planctomycetaceae bacterium]|nr:MobA/MobL family protein [Planctomycetaceae bacterium]
TGEIHDYTRKSGVLHSEVMAPDATPDWMQDRAQLWNAVEAVESRKNSQLAREIQLSLPHELTHEQRRELVRDFVQEQFVGQGMIADIAIHSPDKGGDQRNHHAHVMLTMRELTGEGFHPKKATEKARSWNSDDQLLQWREQWAHHQNRSLERHGHKTRVDHRSFEAQGIDREPSQHMGHVASAMEKDGKPSRIGDENRQIANDNFDRVQNHIEAALLSKQHVLEKISDIDRQEIENAQKLTNLDLSQKHHRQNLALEEKLEQTYGTAKATIKAEVAALDRKLEAKGVVKILRSVFGQTRSDKETRRQMSASLKGIETREAEQRGALKRRQENERGKEARKQNKRRDAYVKTKREKRESGRGANSLLKRGTKRVGRPDRAKAAKPAPIVAKAPQNAPQATKSHIKPNFKDTAKPPTNDNEPTLAEKKTNPANHKLDEKRGDLKRPWESNIFSSENKRPWESELLKPDKGRTRSPSPSPSGN